MRFVSESGLIDPNYYLINGADVHEAALDPAEHFCRYGWREGRKPNIYFDMQWYLQTNPDVARLGINPLVHYMLRRRGGGTPAGAVFRPAVVSRDLCDPGRRRMRWRIT